MQRVSQKYRKSITEVFKIITMLPKEDREKIPKNVQEFFEYNSIPYLLNQMEMNSDIIKNNLSLMTKRFLKIVELYVNR